MDPERLTMCGDQVLLRVEARPDMAGLLHIPDGSMETSMGVGVVLAVGPGAWERTRIGTDTAGKPIYADTAKRRLPDVKVGDRVALLWPHLKNMCVAGDLSVVAEKDLWGVLEG
jgi:hypothetical protein